MEPPPSEGPRKPTPKPPAEASFPGLSGDKAKEASELAETLGIDKSAESTSV
jgi:hypothetical protein